MSRKRMLFPLLLLVLALTVAACGPATPAAEPATEAAAAAPTQAPTEAPTEAATEAPTAEPTEAPAEPIAFTDALGNEVALEGPAQRIVSLAPSVTETLFAIGAGDQVVGRTDFCNYPEAALDLPSVGGFSTISLENILALEPDLVIGGSAYQADTIQALNEAGVPAFIVDPASLEEILDQVTLFGLVTGHEAEAEALAADMQARIEAVAAATEAIPPESRPTVFYEVWHEPLMTVSSGSFIGQVIETAGGVNIFADLPDAYPMISAEEVIAADPDFIIGPSSHADQLTAEVIAAREGWEALTAVQNGSIYIIDGDIISRPGPRIVDALEELAGVLQPVAAGGE